MKMNDRTVVAAFIFYEVELRKQFPIRQFTSFTIYPQAPTSFHKECFVYSLEINAQFFNFSIGIPVSIIHFLLNLINQI